MGRKKESVIPRKRHTAEQMIGKLREAEVVLAAGQTIEQACSQRADPSAICSGQALLPVAPGVRGSENRQLKRLKELETENSRLKRAVAGLTLDKQFPIEAAEGKF